MKIGLADSISGKIFLVHHQSYLFGNQTTIEVSGDLKVWLDTDNYILTVNEKKILLCDTEWLNDNITEATQKLICTALGRLESYQSGLNWQNTGIPFFKISEEHIQLMHNSANHWLVSCSSNDRVQICDSLYTNLTPVIKNCLKALYKSKVEKSQKLSVTIVPVQKQSDGYNCRLYAIAFATDVLNGLSPVGSCFDVNQMRSHLLQCLETEELTVFPKTPKRVRATNTAFKVLKIYIPKD